MKIITINGQKVSRPYRARWHWHCLACRRAGRAYAFTTRKPPAQMRKPCTCPACGSEDVADKELKHVRRRARRQATTCHCPGVPHPHQVGTHRLCQHHKLASVPLTTDEIRDYESVMLDPRRTAYR